MTRVSRLLATGTMVGLSLVVAACKGPGASVAPGGFAPLSPGGTPHAQYVVVGDIGNHSLLTYNLGTSSALSTGNLSPAYNNHSATISRPFFIFNDFQSNLWAANFGNASVTWYAVNATGGTPVYHTLSGPATTFACPTGIYISQNGTIYVADTCATKIDIFAPNPSKANTAPSAWISGSNTTLGCPQGLSLDSQGNIWVADCSNASAVPVIDEFAPVALGSGANNIAPKAVITSAALSVPLELYIDFQNHLWIGDNGIPGVVEFTMTGGSQTPLCQISGSNTGFGSGQITAAVDNGGYVYIVSNNLPQIDIFRPGHCGNIAPDFTISGGATGMSEPSAVLVYSTSTDY